ncbi:hypothetical protein N7492_004729 [Penicillium capsulatum]|uniref:Uncharacterized protein n=1 Tax=Penicillium capsulatum TaxID=69766 RepID=A0A9W9LR07_9EURO|nr:hypothetical protein N7492_004729 [Penicillium capsulatum]
MWRSLDSDKRAKCLKAGPSDGVVLKDRLDQSLGDLCMMLSDWNLREIAESGPDYLLSILKHRATTSLLISTAMVSTGTLTVT